MNLHDRYHLVTTITTREAADKYFDYLVTDRMKMGHAREKAVRIEKNNIAHWVNGYEPEVEKRVVKLFNIEPIESL